MGEYFSVVITSKQILAQNEHTVAETHTGDVVHVSKQAGCTRARTQLSRCLVSCCSSPNVFNRCGSNDSHIQTLCFFFSSASSVSAMCVCVCVCVCVRFPGPAHRGPNHPDPVLMDVSVLLLPQLALLQTHQRTDALLCP